MITQLLRPALCVASVFCLLMGATAQNVQAEPVFIGGAGLIEPHATLGTDGFQIGSVPPSGATIANEPDADLGPVSAMTVRISLAPYATADDPLNLEPATFTVAGGDIVLTFGPAVFTQLPPPSGIIGSGDIKAPIIGASTTIPGVNVSQFVGGSFQMTFTGALISAGTGSMGGGSVAFDFISTASFTISTPEPGSVIISLLGAVGGVGLVYRLRRA